MKLLLVMRHAKSDWNADYGSDHQRPLNQRGERSARLMGPVVAAAGHAPQLIVSSTAVRARSTAVLANEAGNWGAPIVLEDRLYEGGVDTAIDVARTAADVERLMLVGHQPTWSYLVSTLSGEHVDIKTATVAVIGFDITEWSELAPGGGDLVVVYQPRDYEGGEP